MSAVQPEPDGFTAGTHDGALFTTKRSTGKNFAKGARLPLCEWYSAATLREAVRGLREAGEPVAFDDCRISLVTALHMLASDFENALYKFDGDDEARRAANGSIAHARKVAARWNWNGAAPPSPAPQPAQDGGEVEPTSEQIALLDPWMRPEAARELLRQVLRANATKA